jgi:eukaryotic-like serine/threonine-protein kinase
VQPERRDPLKLCGQIVAEKYRIEALVGEGGFSHVYRAQHTIWKKPAAIKFFSGLSTAPEECRDELYRSFIQEGALLTELCGQTASIVQARDVGSFTSAEGQWLPYMVLEWLEGKPLDELLETGQQHDEPPWSLLEMMRLLGPAAAGLELAHQRGIAHRDIKPGNLFVTGSARGDNPGLKILDFGVAKIMSDRTLSAALARTQQGFSSFTPQYGAPEQFSREHGATGPWTDVFALALVAMELLVGRPALGGDSLVALGRAASDAQRRPTPRAFSLPVPDEVERVFERALAVRPAERYQTAGEFWRELALAAGVVDERLSALPLSSLRATVAPVSLQPARTERSRSTLPAGRERRRQVFGLCLAAVAAMATAFFVSFALSARPERPVLRALAAAAAAVPALPEVREPVCPPSMVTIPGGQFFMGSEAPGARDDQKPIHNVTLGAFCMDPQEVTVRQYETCSDVGKCRRAPTEVEWPKISGADRQRYTPLCNGGNDERGDHPINCVTWEMASTYCAAQGKRLPTEAEWEYAARGPDGRIYPWGDEAPSAKHANACGKECVAWGRANGAPLSALHDEDDGYAATAPVGRFPMGSSRFGLQDVAGNVWEWTASYYGAYTPEAKTNPAGPASGERRVIRGGAFNGAYESWMHPSHRYGQDPAARSHGIGFRCAADLTP